MLDVLAEENGLRHLRGGYYYERCKVKNPIGGWYTFFGPGKFRKIASKHVFKPYYEDFLI